MTKITATPCSLPEARIVKQFGNWTVEEYCAHKGGHAYCICNKTYIYKIYWLQERNNWMVDGEVFEKIPDEIVSFVDELASCSDERFKYLVRR